MGLLALSLVGMVSWSAKGLADRCDAEMRRDATSAWKVVGQIDSKSEEAKNLLKHQGSNGRIVRCREGEPGRSIR